MSSSPPESGQTTALVLVGLALLAIPTGLALAQGLTTAPMATTTDSALTPTLPPMDLTQTSSPTDTATDTTETPQGDANTLLVDGPDGGVPGDLPGEEADCNADYDEIQEAINDAGRGDTIIVCEGQYDPVEVETANLVIRARGPAEIISDLPDRPAVRITAPKVTLQGFVMRAPQASRVLAVGAPKTHVRNTTVHVTNNESTGIFLSDGLTPEGGKPDQTLGAATGSYVTNNTVYGSDDTFSRGVFTDADQTVIRNNTFFGEDETISIRSSGNKTVIRKNIIQHLDPCRQEVGEAIGSNPNGGCFSGGKPPAILIGETGGGDDYPGEVCRITQASELKSSGHNWARQNLIEGNSVSYAPGEGLAILGMGTHSEAVAATKGVDVRHNTFYQSGDIGGWSKGAVIKNNTMDIDNRRTGESTGSQGTAEDGFCGHFDNSRIIGNSIDGYYAGIRVLGTNLTVESNVVRDTFGSGLNVGSLGQFYTKVHRQHNVVVNNNTVTGTQYTRAAGLSLGDKANYSEVAYNHLYDNTAAPGVVISGNVTAFHHNTITGNGQSGIEIAKNATVEGFHYNVIDNNRYLGIDKVNTDKTDDSWSIVNATRNYWGCGGPSGGLQDPITNRTANGSGDPVSASDQAGISNVHFDPFFTRPALNCPAGTSNTPEPTATDTATPTPTQTPTTTPRPTPTPSPTPPAGPGNETGGTGGNGTGGQGERGTDSSEGTAGPGNRDADGTTTATAPPPAGSATPTPPPTPTRSPTPTISPTPRVEPGFGVLTWVIGAVLLGALVSIRRRLPADSGAEP